MVLAPCLALLALVDFAYVVRRARREWNRGDELSRATAHWITSVYVLTGALLVLAVVWRPSPLAVPWGLALVLGGALVIAGTALARPGFRRFAGVEQLWGVERGGLITDGIYRFSRNPQYTGIGVALVGAGFAARSGLALIVVCGYWLAIRIWLVAEEEHLERAFGPEYREYRARAPRFLGLSRPAAARRGS